MNFIKKYFLYLIIGLLLILLLLSRCNKPKPGPVEPIIKRDTVWISHVDTVYTKPKVVYTKPDTIYELKWLPNPDYDKLKQQYNDLLKLYFSTNTVKDTLRLDSLGHVYVTDWVWKNKIESRKFTYNIKVPVIKETITNPVKPRNQLYIGGALQGNLTNPVSQINAGVLLKNKKDQIFGAYTGVDHDGQLNLGIQSYWKIHIGK